MAARSASDCRKSTSKNSVQPMQAWDNEHSKDDHTDTDNYDNNVDGEVGVDNDDDGNDLGSEGGGWWW